MRWRSRKSWLWLSLASIAAVISFAQWHRSIEKPAYGMEFSAWAGQRANSDHSMFGGSNSRNFVNLNDRNLSVDFPKSPDDPHVSILGTRVLWKQELGSRAYGGPIISGGKILVGTNNDNPRNDRDRGKKTADEPKGEPIDKGILMCFDEATGKFLWQAVHDHAPYAGILQCLREGVRSTPVVQGKRVYYTSNRCEIVCVDLDGFSNGNDGDRNEKYTDNSDADILWSVDMKREFNVFPHGTTICSPLIVGDLLLAVTGNGVDENHLDIPSPEAPSFIALNKNTGKLVWKSNLPGSNILHGQWSNCAVGTINGTKQAIFPGGDGWLYSLEVETGKLIWKFDANPKSSKYEIGGVGTRSDFMGTPVIIDDKVYIGTGQDPEHFEGVGHFYCIDATKKGDVSPDLVLDASKNPPVTKPNPNSALVWHYGGDEKRPFARRDHVFGRTLSTACIVDGVVYIAELAGYLHCLDAKTGKKYWHYDLKAPIWGSAYYVDGKIILANEDGAIFFFKHETKPFVLDEVAECSTAGIAAEKKAIAEGKRPAEALQAGINAQKKARKEISENLKSRLLLAYVEIDEAIRTTPIVANGVLYVVAEKTLFAVSAK